MQVSAGVNQVNYLWGELQAYSCSTRNTSQTINTTKGEMLDIVAAFYSTLYLPDSADLSSIDSLLRFLLENLYLSETAQTMLISPITYDGILEGISCCPKRSSPGPGGLSYEILRIIICPSSFVSLLPKCGDLSDLQNWRPISLINTDAKIYTRDS
ncbi:hypothetical protein BCV72DRAFT_257034 [Rhizopus microsporus var. microsporus]|uniref:Reverse transcriptase domain-containing protein n=1 Tax=Rhizopus microsporus var. microsporus TaxID=86635 RepID=A0A1X0QYY3_RHIZD|nr:hypothetical protein BCV72DRAFT_257034 [Rhizopus microsporus var. microsporus]